jgi:hypothetical protein
MTLSCASPKLQHPSLWEGSDMTITRQRRRFKQTTSLTERLHQFADEARAEAGRLPAGEARDQALAKVQVTERALQMEGWLSSPGLKPLS